MCNISNIARGYNNLTSTCYLNLLPVLCSLGFVSLQRTRTFAAFEFKV